MNIIKLLILNSDGLAFVIALITIASTYYLTNRTSSQEIVRERHEKLISPIFFLLEPYLFSCIDNDTLENLFDLINLNKHLADGKLLEITYFCSENPSQSNYNALSSYINKAYDNSCKRLGLKTRSIVYRVSRKQYKDKLSLFFYYSIIIIQGLLFFAAMLLITLSLLGACIYIFDSRNNPETQLIFLLPFVVIFYIFVNHSYRES